MKIALVTIHSGEVYEKLAELTWHNNRAVYASKNGYDAIARTDNFGGMNLGFAKIAMLLDVMHKNEHEAVFWSGTDTIITNFNIKLPSLLYDGFHVTMATDFNGLQSDSILIRNTIEGRAWLKMILDNMPTYLNHPFLEQGVMMETYNQFKHIVKLVPQRYMNSYMYDHYKNKGAKNSNDALGFSGQWEQGDFLLHAPDQPMSIRIPLFNDKLSYVVGSEATYTV
jgi:hypothetical protein